MTLTEKQMEAKKKLEEMGTITKYFRAEVKEIDKDNHTVLVTMSDQTLDSYRDIIDANGWKKHLARYKAHPVLLSSHNYGSLRNQIGISEKTFVQDDALKARLKYFVNAGNEEADWGWALAERGIAAYSVGFSPKAMRYWNEMTEDEQKEARKKYKIPAKVTPFRIFLEQELLENSQVVIPSNPNAVQEGLKDKECVVRKAAEDITAIMKVEADAKTKADIEKIWEDEEGWKEIKYSIKNPDLFVDDSFRRKKMPGVTPAITMIVAKLKSDPDGSTKLQSLRFPKISWTLAKAKAWVKEHPDIGKTIEELETKGLDTLEDAPEDVKPPVKDEPADVIVETETVETKTWKCPHCKNKIGEKELFYDETKKLWYHRPCIDKGAVKLPVKANEEPLLLKLVEPKEPKDLTDEEKEQLKQLASKVSDLTKKLGGAGGESGDKPVDDAESQNLYAEILKLGKDALSKCNPKKKE